MQTEEPYWLEEAYEPENEKFDSGQATRSIKNAAFIRWLINAARIQSPRVLDYGSGSGLLVRLLRDAGIDAWGLDKYSVPRLSTGFQVENPIGFNIINMSEVVEHFNEPKQTFDAIFGPNPSIVVIETAIMQAIPDSSWYYLADFHGQHIFFLSTETIIWIAKHYRRHVCMIQGYLIFANEEIECKHLDSFTMELAVDQPNLQNEAMALTKAIFDQPYYYPLIDLQSTIEKHNE
jgi:2-polyprenyl-3-methyl-5-hydroxy-6-metoxy-1,4-benzoquinol methylase